MAFHVTLSDGTTETYDADGDVYLITPGGVLEIAATEAGRHYRKHYSPSAWNNVAEFSDVPGKKPKRALILR